MQNDWGSFRPSDMSKTPSFVFHICDANCTENPFKDTHSSGAQNTYQLLLANCTSRDVGRVWCLQYPPPLGNICWYSFSFPLFFTPFSWVCTLSVLYIYPLTFEILKYFTRYYKFVCHQLLCYILVCPAYND